MTRESARTILLVEDEGIVAVEETEQLRDEGYLVFHAATGEKAVELVRAAQGRIDIILMDINLGRGMDGTQTAREIHKDYDIPVLFLSSHSEKGVVDKTEKITSYGYVLKDSGIAVLLASIHTAFNLHQARQELQAKEQALRESGRLLEETQLISKVGGWEYNLENGRMIWTDEIYRINGLDKTFDPNDRAKFIARYEPEDQEIFKRAFAEAVRDGTPYDLELRLASPDGKPKWVRTIGKPRVKNGKVVKIVGNAMDITEWKLAEKALRESEERHRLISSLTTDYFFRINVGEDGRVVMDMISDNFPSVTGRTLPDVASPDLWRAFIHPDDLGMLLDQLRKLLSEGGSSECECRSVVHEGRTRWIHVMARAVRSADGRRTTAIVGAVKDITERKQAEEALRESKRLLDDAQSISKIGGWEFDLESNRMTWTDEVYRIYGVDKTFDPNDLEKGLSFYLPSDQETVKNAYFDAIGRGKPYDLEVRFQAADGTPKWVRTIVKPVFKEDKVIRVFGNFMDITERKRAEELLQQTINQKEILMKEIQHRVKNSLAVVAGLLSLEIENLPDPRSREIFNDTRSRIRSVSAVYERLYRSAEPDRVNLRVLITELTDSLPATLSIEPNRVRIKTDIEDITLDTKRAVPLALILNELVTNAVKYAHAGGGSVEIRIELHRWDKKVGLCVTDDGSGFPENIDPKTAESIGLSLIRMLAEQIDGELTFRKEKGTRICLEFTL